MSQHETTQPDLAMPERVIESPQEMGRLAKLGHNLSQIALASFVALEVNPLSNEGLRLGVSAIVGAGTRDPYLAAATFAGTTLVVEGSGAIATSKLLASETGGKAVRKINDTLEQFKLSRFMHTNTVTEAAIASVAGAPAVMFLKHRQDPERTEKQNRRYGMIASLGITAMSGAQGYLVAEGISTPNPLTIGVAAAAVVGAIVGAKKWIGSRFSNQTPEKNEASSAVELIDYATYEALAHEPRGPQLREYSQADFENTIGDERTRYAKINIDGELKSWPVLTPIQNYSEYVPGYFVRRYGEDQALLNTYHLSLPSSRSLMADPEARKDIASHLLALGKEDATIVYDELDGDDTLKYVQDLVAEYDPDATFQVDGLVDEKNNTPASEHHYAARATPVRDPGDTAPRLNTAAAIREQYFTLVRNGEVNLNADSKTVLLDPSNMDAVLETGETVIDRLWNIYDGQFTRLIENNPTRGAQYREELESMARDPDTFTVAHMVDGDIVSFGTFVSNIEACDWLNPKYYKDNFPDELTLYFPGIATDIEKEGQRYSFDLVNLLTKMISPSVDSVQIVFQCTNVSRDYIPAIVEAGVNATGLATIVPVEKCHYNYRAMKIAK